MGPTSAREPPSRWSGWPISILAALIGLLIIVAAVTPLRTAALRGLGGMLMVSDPLDSADIAVMTESGEAGELELSDLYHEGVMPRVMVLAPTPTAVDRELSRRGVHREDLTLTALVQLGIPRDAITMVDAGEGGTTDSTRALAAWVAEHPSRVLVVISATHTRRFRRTLRRVWPAGAPFPRLRSPRADSFRAADWWESRRTRRDGLFELQKLVWDYVQHPW